MNKEEILLKLNEAFLPQNIECDGAICTGCWKNIVKEAIKMLNNSSILSDNQTAIPFICPVCNGRGKVYNTFYNTSNLGSTSSSISDIECRTCNGATIIYSSKSK